MLPMSRPGLLQQRIDKIKQQIAALGDLRPGALSQQYNVCGTTQFVREEDLAEVQTQLDNYRRLRELVDEWITLSSEISSLRVHELRQAARAEKTKQKSQIAKEGANSRPESKGRRSR
jgi:hypothetical protein